MVVSERNLSVVRAAIVCVVASALYLPPLGSCSVSLAPKFVDTIPNVTVTAGRDAALPCSVNNIGDHKVTWMHLDRVMLLTIDDETITLIPRFDVTREDASTWTLHIRNVEPADTGYYVCQVNMEPTINQVGYVQVVVPPRFLDEESSASHVSVQEGNDVRLVCHAKGVPEPAIRWAREDSRAFSPRGSQAVVKMFSKELLLKSVTRKDMGAYLCIASNKVPPSISKRIVLDVHFMPLIQVPNQLVGAPIGTSVTLECKVDAFPNAVHYWNFNGQLLINSTRQETQEIRDGYTTTMKLSLRNLHRQDFGTYVCSAKNSLGETESNVRLYEIVVDRGGEEPTRDHQNYKEPVLRPEQRNDDRPLDSWDRPEIDSGSPGYTLEETNLVRGNGRPATPLGGMGSSLGGSRGSDSSGRSSLATSSSTSSLCSSSWRISAWCSSTLLFFSQPVTLTRSKVLLSLAMVHATLTAAYFHAST